MKWYNDMFKMISKTTLLLCGAAALAAAEDSTLVQKQKSLIETLDSTNSAVAGLRLGGTARAGVLSSGMSSDQLKDGTDHRDNQAYSDVNLEVHARPSSETEARVELRLHKDWQSAYEESVNPIIGHWFSYDGKILNKHVDFNLGYMRVGYTPLTLYVPQTEILQEPEIFATKRRDALAMRNLDTSSNRLLQGLNFRYNSFELGPLSNLYVQMTGARIRNSAKKYDEVFFDFDESDRWFAGANAGIEAFGFNLGGNYVYTFDRVESTRSNSSKTATVYYEDNMVFSGIAGYNTSDLIMDGAVKAGVGAEIAKSNWTYTKDEYGMFDTTMQYDVVGVGFAQYDENGYVKDANGNPMYDTLFYVREKSKVSEKWVSEELEDRDGMALNVTPYVEGSIAGINFDLKATIVKNDKDFWSEQAASNYYVGNTTILNSEALFTGSNEQVVERFRSGSLENMYFAVYNTNVLQQQNMMSKNEGRRVLDARPYDSYYSFGRLYNNYRLGHFYKNGYKAVAYKYQEYMAAASFIDPSVNMALPMGLATPDRQGVVLNGNFSWNSAVTLNVRMSKLAQDAVSNDYTSFGGGLGVDVAPFLGLDRRLILQGSYEMGDESDLLKRKTSRIIAGLTADVWGPFTLLGGMQMLKKEFGNALSLDEASMVVVNDIDEMLAMGGLQIKLGPGVAFDLQGGVMSNTVNYTVDGIKAELGIDKLLLMGSVTVLF